MKIQRFLIILLAFAAFHGLSASPLREDTRLDTGWHFQSGAGADKFRTRETTPQSDHKRGLWILLRKISAHGVDLSFDGVACHGAFGPAFWNHRAYPHIRNGKQYRGINRFAGLGLNRLCVKRIAVQCEMRCFGNNGASKDCLKLGSGFKPLH